MLRVLTLILLSFALFTATGCQTPPAADTATEDTPVATAETAEEAIAGYQLGAGDKLRVIVFNEEELSGEFQVDGSGMVSLPLVGQLNVSGQTVPEFEETFEKALTGRYLRDPQVSAEVLEFRPFYILGEVRRPGTYPYTSGLTVLNAVATAEGFTYRANQRIVFIRRDGQEEEARLPLTSNTLVHPGDTIRIAERIF